MWYFDNFIKEKKNESELSDNPVDIFNSLNASDLKDKLWVETLRDYQSSILTDWYNKKDYHKNFSVDLETWAGKTIIWLLISESLRIKEKWQVVYLCVTRQLAEDVFYEWKSMWLKVSLYLWWSDRKEENMDSFLWWNSILITTYHALLNNKTTFNIDDLKSVIFDDFHRYPDIYNSLYSISIKSTDNNYKKILNFLYVNVKNNSAKSHIKDFIEWKINEEFDINLSEIISFYENFKDFIKTNNIFKDNIQWDFFYDYFDKIFIWISNNEIVFSLPYNHILNIFKKDITYKIFLSATVFLNSFYYKYTWLTGIELIKPSNSSDLVSERLFLRLDKNQVDINSIVDSTKVLFIFSNNYEVTKYSFDMSKFIDTTIKPEEQIKLFRNNDEKKSLILINRLDWIDFKWITRYCFIWTSFYSNFSLQDKIKYAYYWDDFLYKERISNNLIQAVWRIVRWRGQRWIFFVIDDRLFKWLQNINNLIFLPNTIKKQIQWWLSISKQCWYNLVEYKPILWDFNSNTEQWKNSYKELMNLQIESISLDDVENIIIFERKFFNSFYNDDYYKCIKIFNDNQELLNKISPQKKWYIYNLIWYCYIKLSDEKSKWFFKTAKIFNQNIKLSPLYFDYSENVINQLDFIQNKRKLDINFLKKETYDKLNTDDFENKVYLLWDLLWFKSLMPDKKYWKWPDVLWIDENNKYSYSFELKTWKEDASKYYKKDVWQIEQHLNAIQEINPILKDYKNLLIILWPILLIEDSASPSDNILFWSIDKYFNFIDNINNNLFSINIISDLDRFDIDYKKIYEYFNRMEKFNLLKYK